VLFRNLKFNSYQFQKPFTPTEIDLNNIAENSTNTPMHHKVDPATDAMYAKTLADDYIDFFISGNLEIFPSKPITDFAMNNLCYMDSFSIFSNDAQSFTRRANYQSFLILYTYEGQGVLEYEGQSYQLSAGDGFIIDCMKPHFYKTEGAFWKYGCLHFNGPMIPGLYQQFKHLNENSVLFSQPLIGSYQATLEKLLTLYGEVHPCREALISNQINQLLTELLMERYNKEKLPKSTLEIIHDVVAHLENNYRAELSLDDLVQFSGLSKFYLSREFKKCTGFSPTDYLIHMRMEHAKTLLLSTTLTIVQISEMVGFRDSNHFSKLFKKKLGKTPGQFRKSP